MKYYMAVEGGGTTWVAALTDDDNRTIESIIVDTTQDPEYTLNQIRSWMNMLHKRWKLVGIGIASFGPLDGNPRSATYGYITSTPKPGWRNVNVVQLLGLYDEFKDIPFIFDTDVNAPALAEYSLFHKQKGFSSCAYITVGTGVGVGLVVNGQTVHGLLHPEAGHLQVKLAEGDDFQGICPYHRTCIEGLCSAGALSKRVNSLPTELKSLSDDDPVWNIFAYYIAQLCVTLILTVSPEVISLGGGVLQRSSLYPKIRSETKRILNGYVQHPYILDDKMLMSFIGPAKWESEAGIKGAAYLAQLSAETVRRGEL